MVTCGSLMSRIFSQHAPRSELSPLDLRYSSSKDSIGRPSLASSWPLASPAGCHTTVMQLSLTLQRDTSISGALGTAGQFGITVITNMLWFIFFLSLFMKSLSICCCSSTLANSPVKTMASPFLVYAHISLKRSNQASNADSHFAEHKMKCLINIIYGWLKASHFSMSI